MFRDHSRGGPEADFFHFFDIRNDDIYPTVFIKVRENEHPTKYVPENCSCK